MVQSGVRASCRSGVAFDDPGMSGKPPASSESVALNTGSREMIALGIKGAALAALGEMPGFLRLALDPLGERKEGVKLGESTFRAFFNWLKTDVRCLIDCLEGEGDLPFILSTVGSRLLDSVIESAACGQVSCL